MKTLTWTFSTRLFHWLLTIGFAAAYILGDFEDQRSLHYAFGLLVGFLIVFRLVFGFIGPRYSHFRDFPVGLSHQIDFAKNFFSNPKTWLGHNPGASVVMLLIFLVGLFCSLTGYILTTENYSLFSVSFNEDTVKEVHEILANSFLILVIAHLLGVIADTVFHGKSGTLASIFTGYKNGTEENVYLTGFQKVFAVVWFIVPFIFFYLAFDLPVKEEGNDDRDGIEQEHEDHDD